jgi:ribonuclease Z
MDQIATLPFGGLGAAVSVCAARLLSAGTICIHDQWPVNMKSFSIAIALIGGVWFGAPVSMAEGARCLIVTLTGTQGGPSVLDGLAGAGTLVRYGDDSNSCGAIELQFDAGRGTNMRLSQLDVSPVQLNAIFFTHMHGDHTEGFADIMMLRWYLKGPKIDIVYSSDASSALGFTNSCRKYVMHIGDPFLYSGEIAERRSEDNARLAGGPAALANVITFGPKDEPQLVWSFGDVKVNAIRSTHTAGHASYRVDTPAGSVVIGGDAANDVPAPPRASSTSDQVERLAKGVDVIVHSTIHPVLGPDRGSGFPPSSFYRQSLATDLGAMAKRAGAKLSFAKTSAGSQVVDLSVMTRALSELDDHAHAPAASAPPLPRWRPLPARPREPGLAPATRRLQANHGPTPHYVELIGFSGSCSPESGPDGDGLS